MPVILTLGRQRKGESWVQDETPNGLKTTCTEILWEGGKETDGFMPISITNLDTNVPSTCGSILVVIDVRDNCSCMFS